MIIQLNHSPHCVGDVIDKDVVTGDAAVAEQVHGVSSRHCMDPVRDHTLSGRDRLTWSVGVGHAKHKATIVETQEGAFERELSAAVGMTRCD